MNRFTIHRGKMKAARWNTAFWVMAVAALFLPHWESYENTGENVYDVHLNNVYIGCTNQPEILDDLIRQAREKMVKEEPELVFLATELELFGREMLFGTVDSEEEISDKILDVLSESRLETLQRAYTVKINDYTVNLASSDDVLALLYACLAKYDTEGNYIVELMTDPERELTVLVPTISLIEEIINTELVETSAGIGEYFEDVLQEVESTKIDFDDFDYGLTGLDFADKVEVVEAYLMPSELTELNKAIEQVSLYNAKEEIYEVQPGDTLSEISFNLNIPVEELIENNPILQDENSMIRVGDELVITVPEPELSVIHHELVYEEESYDAPVEYVDVPEWYTTQQEVIRQPSAGFRKAVTMKTSKNDTEISESVEMEEVLYEAIPKVVKRGTKVPPTYVKPISGGRLSSGYGGRNAPVKGASTNHKGIDWAVPVGTAVMASNGGTITKAGWGSGYGYCVYIRHEDGRETRYAHLSKVLVSVGQHVNQGQKIALSGNTGRSSGPHLHFELRINGAAVNPLKYLE